MATTPEFKYAPMFQTGKDETEYYLLTKEGVSVAEFNGKEILMVSKEALTQLTQQAFYDVSFHMRREMGLGQFGQLDYRLPHEQTQSVSVEAFDSLIRCEEPAD